MSWHVFKKNVRLDFFFFFLILTDSLHAVESGYLVLLKEKAVGVFWLVVFLGFGFCFLGFLAALLLKTHFAKLQSEQAQTILTSQVCS